MACSTKKNTAGSRFWHSFTARYNTYFNGHEAYKEGLLTQEKGNVDDYTEMLPVFAVANEKTRSLGKGHFDIAVTKSEKAIQLHSIKRRPEISAGKKRDDKLRSYLKREEFNPFLKYAWMMVGQAQFHKGDFIEAASTFSYITRHYAQEPEVVNEARAWLARSYAQLDWYYDAEDALTKMRRDTTLNRRLTDEMEASMADLLLRQERYEEALPYLEQAARDAGRKAQKARLYYLLAQVNQHLGRRPEAYDHLKRCLRQAPNFELAFNARILQAEVLSEDGQAKQMIARLKTMARNPNNKEYLDKVYYALGNAYLAEGDTARGISAFEQGRAGSVRNGVEKGILSLRLGEIYWSHRRFDLAKDCYSDAVSLLSKTHASYKEAMKRSAVLDRLVPYTNAVYLNDSLLRLAALPEAERNAAIERCIAAEKARQKKLRQEQGDSAARARAAEQGITLDDDGPQGIVNQQNNKEWYFYNPATLAQGKKAFQRDWGRRRLEDDWRRLNKSVIALTEPQDTTALAAETQAEDTTQAEVQEEKPLDPLTREFYLAQIPFTDEAKQKAHMEIQEGLYHAGLIEKDELEDFPLAAETLKRLERQYPQFDQMEDVYYQLFLLYMRWGRTNDAYVYRDLLAQHFPGKRTTQIVTNPDFLRNAHYGIQIEDSLYTSTYDAFRRGDFATVEDNERISADQFPNGANRAKFLFVKALSGLGRRDDKSVASELRALVEAYPKSDVSEMAGMIVKGLENGRKAQRGYDVGSLWARRATDAKAGVQLSKEEQKLSPERNTPFLFLAGYAKDSINANQMLFDIARFNFTRFTARSFDIAKETDKQFTTFSVSGFRSYDEAHAYAQRIFEERSLASRLRRGRILIVSEKNLRLIGSVVSYKDYQKFYEQAFAPLKINPALPLDEPGVPEQQYEDVRPVPEVPAAVLQPKDSTNNVAPVTKEPELPREGEILIPIAPATPDAPADEGEIIVPATPAATPAETKETTVPIVPTSPAQPATTPVVPAETEAPVAPATTVPTAPAVPTDKKEAQPAKPVVVPATIPTPAVPTAPAKPVVTPAKPVVPAPPATPVIEENEGEIIVPIDAPEKPAVPTTTTPPAVPAKSALPAKQPAKPAKPAAPAKPATPTAKPAQQPAKPAPSKPTAPAKTAPAKSAPTSPVQPQEETYPIDPESEGEWYPV